MKNDKEKWIEGVFESVKGSQRAKPSSELFKKIENQIYNSDAKVIPMNQLRIAAAAAVLLLFFNVFTIRQNVQSNAINNEELVVSDATSQPLISNYNLYE